jgi:hypothetical protein
MHQVSEPDNRVERRPKRVRHVGKELTFQPVRLSGLAAANLKLGGMNALFVEPSLQGHVSEADPGAI